MLQFSVDFNALTEQKKEGSSKHSLIMYFILLQMATGMLRIFQV